MLSEGALFAEAADALLSGGISSLKFIEGVD
jgi:hypothetical protein